MSIIFISCVDFYQQYFTLIKKTYVLKSLETVRRRFPCCATIQLSDDSSSVTRDTVLMTSQGVSSLGCCEGHAKK